jgi:hypothetical protein
MYKLQLRVVLWKKLNYAHLQKQRRKYENHEQLSSTASWNLLSYVAGSPNSQRLNLEKPELSDEFLAGRRHLTIFDDGSRCGCRVLFLVIC